MTGVRHRHTERRNSSTRRASGLVRFAFLGVTAALLAGCAGGGEELAGIDPSKQKVLFWHQHDGKRRQALQTLVNEFNITNSHGIELTAEYAGEYRDIYNRMPGAFRDGSPPQLVVAYSNQAHPYYLSNWVVDLAPYMTSSEWGLGDSRNDYFKTFLEQDEVKGVQVAFPPHRSMEILYCNMDWLGELGRDEPPRTWSEFAEVAKLAVERPFSRSGDSARSLGLLLDMDASRLASMVFSRGGDFMNKARTAYTFDTAEARASLTMIKDLMASGAVALSNDIDEIRGAFGAGQVLFAMLSSSHHPRFAEAVEQSAAFQWDVAAVPYEGDHPVVNIYGASIAICRTTPEQQLASWIFLKWFTDAKQQASWVKDTNYFPVRRSTARDFTPFLRTAYSLLESGKAEPSGVWYDPVRRMLSEAMSEILAGGDMGQILSRVDWEANNLLFAGRPRK